MCEPSLTTSCRLFILQGLLLIEKEFDEDFVGFLHAGSAGLGAAGSIAELWPRQQAGCGATARTLWCCWCHMLLGMEVGGQRD